MMRSSSSSSSSLLFGGAAATILLVLWTTTSVSAFPFPSPVLPPFPFSPSQLPFANPWLPFQNLSGCQLGDERPGLAGLKGYFSHFGYLPPPPPNNFTDAFDAALEAAVTAYQHNFGLNATGALDPATVDQLMAPRCGVPDVINGTSSMRARPPAAAPGMHMLGRNLYAYFPGNPTWPPLHRELTYAFVSTSAVPIGLSDLRAVFARAFARWSDVTTITFAEAEAASADIKIGFYSGDHGDGEPFDGPLGTLAHSFSPTDGRFHLDAAERWVAEGDVARDGSALAVDLESVAVHEIGHLLGLGHSAVAEAIMYPTIRTRTRKVELAEDDVVGVQALYGSNPNFKGVPPPPPPATSSRETESSDGGGGAREMVRSGPGRVGGVVAVVAVGLLLVF